MITTISGIPWQSCLRGIFYTSYALWRNRKVVRLILGVLSLYLQTALVLFFIGVIDFLHAVENKTVVVSVTIAIIITLIFLMAATALPSVQVTFLQFLCIFPLRLKEPPSQCPYKSPQLNLFCASSDTFPQFSHLLWCFFGIFFDTFWAIIETQGLKAWSNFLSNVNSRHLDCRLSSLCSATTWLNFNSVLLHIRDTYGSVFTNWIPDLTQPKPSSVRISSQRSHSSLLWQSYSIVTMTWTLAPLTISHIHADTCWGENIPTIWLRNRYLRSWLSSQSAHWPIDDDKMIQELKLDTYHWLNDTASTLNAISVLHEFNIEKILTHRSVQSKLITHHQEVYVQV